MLTTLERKLLRNSRDGEKRACTCACQDLTVHRWSSGEKKQRRQDVLSRFLLRNYRDWKSSALPNSDLEVATVTLALVTDVRDSFHTNLC